jgi:hypothetical protein
MAIETNAASSELTHGAIVRVEQRAFLMLVAIAKNEEFHTRRGDEQRKMG